jgi:hypothetical protein
MVNAVLLYLNTQTPKMPCLAILGNTIRLRALRNLFGGIGMILSQFDETKQVSNSLVHSPRCRAHLAFSPWTMSVTGSVCRESSKRIESSPLGYIIT